MKRTLLLLLSLLLVVLVAAACGKDKTEDAADSEAADNMLTVSTEVSLTEANYLEYDNGQVTCRFRKDEDTWKWVDNEGFPLDASYLESLLTMLTEPDSAPTLLESAVELADCGLDDPQRYLSITVGEETTTLYFGDQKDEMWYMSIEGTEDIYLVSNDIVALTELSIYDMAVLPTLPELTADNLTTITLAEYGDINQTVRISNKVNGWFVGSKTLSEDTIAEIEAALATLSFDKCFNYDPSPDAAPLCGLEEPSVRITISYNNTVGTETEIILTLGLLREDGCYYATLNDDTTVYLISQDKLAPLFDLR